MKSLIKIGHRGAKGTTAENTIASFQKAVDLGADGIELDVHLSADGHVIVIHDDTTDRTTIGKGKISELKLHELKKFRINGKYEIPTLEETIEILGKNPLINIELKVDLSAKPVVKTIRKFVKAGWSYTHLLVSSFDWNSLKAVRESDTEIPLGVLTETDLELAIAFADFLKAETIHPHFTMLTGDNVRQMQKLGFKVFCWTVNMREDLARMQSFGVDGIITDYPERL